MQPTHIIVIDPDPDPADTQRIGRGLAAYNREHAGDSNHQPLTIFVRDAQGEVLGGLLGNTFYGWLAVNLLWVDAAWRGQGYGRSLLRTAEAEAIRRGCRYALVNTLDFQALDFYLKEGYQVFGELPGLPPGHTRYYLRKDLVVMSDE